MLMLGLTDAWFGLMNAVVQVIRLAQFILTFPGSSPSIVGVWKGLANKKEYIISDKLLREKIKLQYVPRFPPKNNTYGWR